MKRVFKIGLIILGALVFLFAFMLFQPMAFLPHQKIVISLPFSQQYDSSTGMIPMGETMFHPKPQVPHGHPGIDFQWSHQVPIIASSDGIITNINHGSSNGIDVTIRNGVYELRYKELDENSLGSNIKLLHIVNKGDFIGYPGASIVGGNVAHYQLHWEFASISVLLDRFCPVTYFDSDSNKRINNIWSNVSLDANQGVKRNFPDICSGDYENKTE
jgi:murein DD-endopeptidase MepM/ murein hydrolase activator NlpD